MVDKTSTTRRRGEVIAFERDVRGRPEIFIFRLIGLPGDRVAVRGGLAIVNDVDAVEPYELVLRAVPADFDAVTVPAGHLFVLGDNRQLALDSRVWGFLPERDVVGRVNLVYFSQEPATGAIRWERSAGPCADHSAL
jgi:signal peptidase I